MIVIVLLLATEMMMTMMIVEAVRMMVMICRRKRRRIYRGGEYGSHTFYWTHISTNPFSTAPGGHHHHQHYVFRRLSVIIICEKISLDTYDAGASKAKDHWSARACDQCLVTPFDAICRRCHLNCGKTLGDRKKFQSVLSVTFSPPPHIHHKNYVLDSKKIQSGLKI